MRTPFARIAGLFGRRRRDAHLDEEIRSHLDLLAADYERRGLSPDEARHAARRAFGAIEPMKEQYRDRLGLPWLDDLARDVRHGVRAMWRSPGFTLACTVMLTLGIGLNLACFQLLNVTTLQPLAVTDPDTLVRFYRRGPQGSISTVSYRAATFIAAHQDVLSAVLTESFMDVVWQDDPSDRQRAAFVSTNWFRDLGYDAGRGRVFTPDDDRPDAESVVVLSHAFWQGRLGGDPDVIGSVVRVNEQPVMVIGVAPADFPGLQLRPVQLWLPAEQVDRFYPVLAVTTSSRSSTAMYGRLRDGVSFEAAVQGLRPALAELAARQPDAFSANEWLEPYSARVRFESPRERRQRMQLALAGGALTMLVLLMPART